MASPFLHGEINCCWTHYTRKYEGSLLVTWRVKYREASMVLGVTSTINIGCLDICRNNGRQHCYKSHRRLVSKPVSGFYTILNRNFQTFSRLKFSEWHTVTMLNIGMIVFSTMEVKLSILSQISEWNVIRMHAKDQAWRIISFFHANRTKKNSSLYQAGKSSNFFHNFHDPVGTLLSA